MEEQSRALVVDDCRISQLLMKHVLTKAGVKADCAGNGEQGLELALKNHYPLIFLDLLLPDIDGSEVCRRIRAATALERPRVYFITALGEGLSPSRVSAAGADGIFFKPIVPSEILAAARTARLQPEVSR